MSRILVVDDDPYNLKLFVEILEAGGYEVINASNGESGVRAAREHHPDLILLDIQMPVMTGTEACKILKSDPETKDIPVIALTAYAMAGDREHFLSLGFDGYIPKPIDLTEFLKTVGEYLRSHQKDRNRSSHTAR